MDCVNDNERFSRWVFYPRFMDESGVLNHKFIFLCPNINEEGISGQLYDRISRQIAIADGMKFCRKKNGKPSEKLVALTIAKTVNLRKLAFVPDCIDVVSCPSPVVHAHAEIRISIDGIPVTGNTANMQLLYYYDRIKDVLSEGISYVSDDETSNF